MSRIPTLDGWRGIAIALVLFDHVQYAFLGRFSQPWMQTGQHGVTIFFVLSGFLITSKFLEGPIDLRSFYIRRVFRLLPVAWTYLAVLLILGLMSHATIAAPSAVLASLIFYRNYVLVDNGVSTWHFWSLSLEEQFYLVWPCVLLLAGLRRCRWIALAGVVCCATYRLLFWTYYNRDFFNCRSQVRADALLVGCLLAIAFREPRMLAWISKWSKSWALPALVMLNYFIARFHLLPPLGEILCIAALISSSVLHPNSLFAQPLTSRVLSTLGVVSYSVYVWQELFMLFAPKNSTAGIFFHFVTVSLCALGSYEYIERPMIRLGHKLTHQHATQTKEISSAA
ncbi:acyltransferase family protein [Acidicapsa acidisoli]|uniref:acyltransferase family protein n=1 Tax=Acidicapsa acidisoli TaxID=1615681 RepID=UPI0021DF7900|nr:acyltransferase [Acidicapsa acidisoli]